MNNYRPISLLPSISKLFERIIHDQVFNYFTSNNLFFDHQYGFRKNHSTELAATELTDRLYNYLDQGNNPTAIFIDLTKAFDTIDHAILISKLKYYGFSDNELLFFRNYLSNRKQYVFINEATSSTLPILTGVPQGSILGPLLFLIYINDLHVCTDLDIIHYADDTCIISPTVFQNINFELEKMSNWLSVNKLSINISKTKYMTFHYHQKPINKIQIPKLLINNENITYVQDFTFLGIIFDETLSWNIHTHRVANKISQLSGLIRTLKLDFPQHILKLIHNSLVIPHLTYGVTLWGFNNCERIKMVHKCILRHLDNQKFNAHCNPICKKLGIPLFDDIFKLACLKFFYKFSKKILPSYFYTSNYFKDYNNHNPRRNVSTSRFSDFRTNIPILQPTLNILTTRRANTRHCIRYFVPHLINTNYIPQIIVEKINTHSFHSFNNHAKRHIIDNYNLICNDVNCFVCQ